MQEAQTLVAAPPANNTAPKPRIEVKTMSVTAKGEKAAPAPEITPETAKAEAELNNSEAQAKAKKRAEDAGKLLKEANINPRIVLRLLSSNDTTLKMIQGQENAELNAANGQRLSPEQKHKLFGQIKEKYKKLLDLVGEREDRLTGKINKLKKSKKPEDQALGMDIDRGITMMQIKSLSQRRDLIKAEINPDTETPLTSDEKTTYNAEATLLDVQINKLQEQKTGLERERAEKKTRKGETIPDLLEATVVAMSGGDAKVIKETKDDPIGYIEKTLAGAVTDKDKMDSLVKNMKTSKLIGDEKDENKFKEALDLSHLDSGEYASMIATNSGKKLLLLLEVLGFLGYVSWQKENNKSQ